MLKGITLGKNNWFSCFNPKNYQFKYKNMHFFHIFLLPTNCRLPTAMSTWLLIANGNSKIRQNDRYSHYMLWIFWQNDLDRAAGHLKLCTSIHYKVMLYIVNKGLVIWPTLLQYAINGLPKGYQLAHPSIRHKKNLPLGSRNIFVAPFFQF